MDKMFVLMETRARGRATRRTRSRCALRRGRGALRGRDFAYEPARPILHDVSFEIPAGQDGGGGRPLGLGQVDAGAAAVPLLRRQRRPHHHRRPGHPRGHAGQPARRPSASCRRTRCCSTTPSNTTSPTAGRARARDEVEAAARAARIHDFIAATPKGYADDGRRARPEALGRREAARGDRAHAAEEPADPDLRRGDLGAGLGQRARDPGRAARARRSNKTALVIAHRLSTVVDAHEILVLEQRPHRRARDACGAAGGRGAYARMWELQQSGQDT